ncbi:MAG: hypothetical protein LBQ66_13210 [Planctomycetaceae bacterium]|nr:hypothetical protein [Planctomycetaceae bacterium]
MPTRFGVQFQLVRFYYAQRRAGRPRSSPSPLRGKLVRYNESGMSAFQSAAATRQTYDVSSKM